MTPDVITLLFKEARDFSPCIMILEGYGVGPRMI
jgi:hypothetical protein